MSFSEPLNEEESDLLRQFISDHPDVPCEELIERLGRILLTIRRESQAEGNGMRESLDASKSVDGRTKRFDAEPSVN